MIVGGVIALLIATLWVGVSTKTPGDIKKGVTFSQIFAESLGLNWRELLTVSLDDLGVRQFRIPAYWNVVQPAPDRYDWSSIDYQLDEIAHRNGKVLLAVGLKLPRWPECWKPDWVKPLTTKDEHTARLAYIEAAVTRYKDHPALESWQVENEANFLFGECPLPNLSFFKQEVALVKRLDQSHPITTTDSGELATWLAVGPQVDGLGVSVYRVVRLPWGSVWPYDWIPPYWYARRALLVSPWVKRVFVSEFQMEPWVEKAVTETPIDRQLETFDVSRMRKNFTFSERMQFDEIYFWGVEWWWWMKTKQSDPRFWDMAREFFQKT
ncbi:hypothetical protein A3E39_04405 [Candidatus Uhrbacteria bacterium RIFCSPHIGHO2_12_FULL_60_25]|uniref:Glycoside hydrolase family 42 N-terminal domain-containing protein n=1 Tax=Candidatus Uhrbacteria bacterium RIFCSPHIGHO2_12_FULL_60_25 TaxID=1802399 RepID=A0A1F7UIQ1_9BACT|nr:MAG: hypothetical protein A3D73_00955 [Candidatus Uhrbacteria bacterium RIFCSPHIGHO2_02_FULL_60_44]OGL78129.1 MAG: hypothetical protein A3E39_04405 [Candidatus Uhrbacteria bacterium RIFCSPHIGHO2_12_FULL_60_25]